MTLIADDMILHMENPKEPIKKTKTEKLLEPIKRVQQACRPEINAQKSTPISI